MYGATSSAISSKSSCSSSSSLSTAVFNFIAFFTPKSTSTPFSNCGKMTLNILSKNMPLKRAVLYLGINGSSFFSSTFGSGCGGGGGGGACCVFASSCSLCCVNSFSLVVWLSSIICASSTT